MTAAAVALWAATAAHSQSLCPAPANWWESWVSPTSSAVETESDAINLRNEASALITGNVRLRHDGVELNADEVHYLRDSELVVASGDVSLQNDSLYMHAGQVEYSSASQEADLEDLSYWLRDSDGRGSASSARLTQAANARLSDVLFTTCPPGDPSWALEADRMDLDRAAGVGRARGVKLRFKQVPLLYLPYARFPLDDRRQSGLLYPSFGSSNDNGFDFALPWYWNIAPNMDATITPRIISDRGPMLQTEYRYMSNFGSGTFNAEYLPDDDIKDTHRALVQFQHYSVLGPYSSLQADLNHVSDETYFEDFGDSLTASSRSFLQSSMRYQTGGEYWSAELSADAFETVDPQISEASEPYNRLPRVVFDGRFPLNNIMDLGLDAELVSFRRDSGIEGERIDVYPEIAASFYRPGYFVRPALGMRYTTYDLDGGNSDSPDRSTAIASLDAGLIFDRRSEDGALQTLEPRLFYLYVPYEDQSDLPRFDTRELTFGFSQLFRTNRFTGADRQQDANQLTLALTSRFYNPDGRSNFDISLGTIVYFRDQRVQLGNRPASDDSTSPLVFEVNYRPSDFWRTTLSFQYDPEDDEFDQTQIGASYRIPGKAIFNIAYRRRTDLVRQLDTSVLWPLNDRWTLIARANYSFLEDTDLETMLGFQYESCCWALRTFARRYVRNTQGEHRNGIYVELELKGLGSLGRSTENVLERAIIGYRSEDYQL